jgi:hypothetical protein
VRPHSRPEAPAGTAYSAIVHEATQAA